MKQSRLAAWSVGAPGLLAWAMLIALPLLALYVAAAWPTQADVSADRLRLTLQSFGLAGAIAGGAVLLGYVPGRLLGTAVRRRRLLTILMLSPLLLPSYVLYYAWTLLLSPTTSLGQYLSVNPDIAQVVGRVTSSMVMVLWYWPLAAVIIAQGWRTIDPEFLNLARLDAGPVRRFLKVTLPLLSRSIGLALAVCFVLSLSEYTAFHLSASQTLGTELAVVYQQTGSDASVARAAWPLVVLSAIVGVMLWRKTRDWSTQPALTVPAPARGLWRWIVLAVLVMLSVVLPLAWLVMNVTDLAPFRQYWQLHSDDLAWSLQTSVVSAALALTIAGGALAIEGAGGAGRWLSGLMHATILLALFLPGSLIAVSIIRLEGLLHVPASLSQGWLVVSAGQAARFAGVALIILRLALEAKDRHLAELAGVDGASLAQTWWHVHLPRLWPVPLAAFALIVMFSMTELPATVILLPAGVPNFAMRLLNQMHYAADRQVVASCLMLVLVYAVLALAPILLLRLARVRASAAVALCLLLAVSLTGCSSSPGSDGRPEVLSAFGKTGKGPGEFIYPRGIDLARDGTLFVVDKTGRVQHLTRDGQSLGAIQMPQTDAGKPVGVTVGPDGNLYVADTHYHRIIVYSPDGRIVRQWGESGQGDGQFIYPVDVAFADGRVLVAEYGGNDRISVFSTEGKFLYSFGAFGSGEGQFSRPSALCVDPKAQRLYVADACNHRIAVYDLKGTLRGYFGSPGQQKGQLRYPYGLSLLPDGTLVVCEFGNNRVQLFSPEGKSLAVYGSAGREMGQLAYPWGVVVDAQRRAYVVDAGSDRIQVWQL